MENFALQYGYFGIFLISLIGSLSIIFPIPYTLVIYLSGSFLNPVLIGISSGIGSAVGEFSGYALGYYGRHVISEERKRKIDFAMKIFNRHGMIVVILFAILPLPDDLLFIPLGMARYSLNKVLLPCFIGKTIMSYVLAAAGQLSIGFVKDFLKESGWFEIILSTAVLIAIIALMLRIDWEKIFLKYFEKKEK